MYSYLSIIDKIENLRATSVLNQRKTLYLSLVRASFVLFVRLAFPRFRFHTRLLIAYNDLPASLPSSVSCSLYADDLAIWSSSPSVPTAVEATQGALSRSERWSKYWCLPLNPSKWEASFFSVDSHQAHLQPNLFLLDSRLRFNPTPTFFGVTFDRTLSFSKHVSSLKAKFFLRLKALRCISASSWGPSLSSV